MINEYGLFIACTHPQAPQYLNQLSNGWHNNKSAEYLSFLDFYEAEIKMLMAYVDGQDQNIKKERLKYKLKELLEQYSMEEIKSIIE